jgi:hypothetical protein
MIRLLTYVALVVTITAGAVLLYRHQPYSVRFEREQPSSFGAVPHVTVNAVPAPTPTPTPTPAPAITPAPAVIENPVAKPSPPPPKRVVKKRAVSKLKSKWSAPEQEPFSLEKLFNGR